MRHNDGRPDQRYQVETADINYYRRAISCQNACPAHTNAQGYVNAISRGAYEEGYIIARQPNPFASICGRVCASPCERACRRGKIDAPVTIRTLKRFLSERYGAEARSHLPVLSEAERKAGITRLNGKPSDNVQTVESFSQLSGGRQKEVSKGKPESAPVAIIGAGPTGLTAAHDLALLGHKVAVFEAASDAGGMALLGIPEYRLPRDVLKLEIGEILDLGVELKLNTRLGLDFSLASLQEQGFGAILIAIGAHKDRWLNIDGADLNGVLAAVDFLTHVKQGHRVNLGTRVAVVGGEGGTDGPRQTARRREADDVAADVTLMTVMDAARQALRSGVSEVHVFYRGTLQEIRASQSIEELDNALEEGIILHTEILPKRIVGSQGKVIGFETLASRQQVDEKGQASVIPIPESESIFECSSVILAIGQESDLSFIRPKDGVAFSSQGAIVADAETLATAAPGIFAAGDAVRGPRTVIDAVAGGHRAARAIDTYLRKERVKVVSRGRLTPVSLDVLPGQYNLNIPRINPPRIPLDRRTGVTEVEGVFDEKAARQQAERCLKCHIQTVFNADLCILCGGCVDVCPQSCYKMVRLDEIEGDEKLQTMVKDKYGVALSAFQGGGEVLKRGTAMLKDETRCVRCGLCAKRCPTGAITMQAFHFEEELVFEESAGNLPQEAGVRQ
ncbi:MAG: FAD-dependent oxidoreductase [Chloroflexi bacterium]|nr:FAD-dependent oxidoreductase [Chloroflexota bacterium]